MIKRNNMKKRWHNIFKQQLEFDKAKVEQQMEHELQMERMRIKEIEKTLYVDDLVSGGETVEKVNQLNKTSTEIFDDATFQQQKRHSNVCALDVEETQLSSPTEETFAQQQLGVRSGQTTLLGLSWDKERDVITVEIPSDKAQRQNCDWPRRI